MKKNSLPFTISPDAKFKQTLRETVTFQEPTKPRPGKVWAILAYAGLVAGVALATYVVTTPAHAAGSMGIDVRVVHVSPSVTIYGTREERRLKADVARDNNRHQQRLELEQQRSNNARALEADRAYYKKLEAQRKGK